MFDFAALLNQGVASAWLFIPSAVLLGALHGLEPGHSKTMMAAFIVAIRGTVGQAAFLAIAATVSHTLIVWVVALGGMWLWQGVDPEQTEPYFQLASGLIIIALALWMLWRTYSERHTDYHHHTQLESGREIDTGHGRVRLGFDRQGGRRYWALEQVSGQRWTAPDIALEAERADGSTMRFAFAGDGAVLRSTEPVAAPFDFLARLSLGHGGHSHDYDLVFLEDDVTRFDLPDDEHQDAHARAHANDIRRRFAGTSQVSTGQIIAFGLTGGLIPCPAAITVLLICLQVDQIALGAAIVLAFSIGLAITLIAVGAIAAVGVSQINKRSSLFSTIARRAPYFSGALIIVVGLLVTLHGLEGLAAHA